MININNLLLEESLHSMLLCNTDECLSYIIVLLNLLTIFYLVYSSYAKVTKIMRLFGYVWSCIIMCATVAILFLHTCIFTVMCAVFTGMAIIAVLSMICEAKQEEKDAKHQMNFGTVENNSKNKSEGSYVIYPTDDDKFVFALHAKNKKMILRSVYKYDTLESAENAILMCREYGVKSNFENSIGDWVLEVNHPKFRLYIKNGNYLVDLAINEKTVMLKSRPIEFLTDASWYANTAMRCINSKVLYFAKGKEDVLKGSEFLQDKSSKPAVASKK